MRTTIVLGGTFTGFRLAEQLHRRGALDRLITTHPPIRGEQIPSHLVRWNLWPEFLMRSGLPNGHYLKAVTFSRWAARYIGEGNLVVAWAQFALPSLRKARNLGVPSVVVRQSLHIEAQREILGNPPSPLVDLELEEYEKADFIEVPTTLARQSFLDQGVPKEKLLLVPPVGVDPAVFHPRSHDVDPNRFRALVVGVSPRKGTIFALEACQRAKVGVWVVGRGRLPHYECVVHRFGAVPQRELASLYRQASVVIIASLEEGLPHVLVEALASGCPVIATSSSGAEDAIAAGGFIVPPRDVEAIAARIRRLRDDKNLWTAMSAAAAETGKRWSWSAYGTRAFDAYQRVLSGSTSGR